MSALDLWCETHGGSPAARREFEQVIERARSAVFGGVLLEIGTHQGASLRVWGEAFEPIYTVGIESEQSPRIIEGLGKLLDPDAEDIDIIFGDSTSIRTHEAVKILLHGMGVDFLYIDGDHRPLAVYTDYRLYGSLVRPGGIIVFDDTKNEPGVRALTDQLSGEYIHGDGDSSGKFLTADVPS